MRISKLRITGVADATQVTCQFYNLWMGEDLAAETVDTDFPTGGVRFDISADGQTITVKGMTKTAVVALIPSVDDSDVTVPWDIVPGVANGDLTIQANVEATGAAVDFSSIAVGLTALIRILYLTSD